MTGGPRGVFVEGVAVELSWADRSRNLMELIFDTVRAAVDDAGVDMGTIDSVVLGAHDLVDGRSLSSMVTAPAAGAYMRDEVRLGDDGAAALAVGVVRLEAGHNARTIVAAWGRASEHDSTAVSRALFDPSFTRSLGLTELDVAAMRAQSWLQAHDRDAVDAARRTRRAAAGRNPRAVRRDDGLPTDRPHPLTADDCPVWADVTAAMVLSTEETAVRVSGIGQSSEPYWLGDRSLLAMPALADAVARAIGEAGISPADVDVVEIDGLTLFDEGIALEAAGMAAPGEGLRQLAEDPRCNPSGGSAAGYCAPGMGLVRIVESVLQLRGQAGDIQLDGARRALATGASTIAAQTQTAVVLEAS